LRSQTTLTRWLERIPRRNLIVGVLVLMVLAGAVGWMLRPERHSITVRGLGQPITFETKEQVLAAALKAKGIPLGEKDVVEPDLSTSLKGKKELAVSVRRAVALTVIEGGHEQKVETAAVSIRELLKELNIVLGDQDRVSIPLDNAPAEGMKVQVVRRTEQVVTVQEEIPFETETHADGNLQVGVTEVVQKGQAGLKEIRRRIVVEDGREVSNEVVEEKVVKEPVIQVVAYGTMGVVSRGGREYRYTRELDMMATGYTAGKESNPDGHGITYTGMRAERGVVAVDPRVIPLYTRLYIEGYGPAIAGDTGGAIKGNRIDLCFDSLSEALDWGIRPVKVYVLSD
jgi:3D (Asp-Asp-Asp) domain-containing protein